MSSAGSFSYANPPAIHWGAGCMAERLDAELTKHRAQRVFLVTTRSVGAHPALGGAVRTLLGDRRAGEFAGIGEHAPARAVAHAALVARDAFPDLLLSLGGGSPIDAAKSV